MEESLKKEFRDAGRANSKKKEIAASTKDRKGTCDPLVTKAIKHRLPPLSRSLPFSGQLGGAIRVAAHISQPRRAVDLDQACSGVHTYVPSSGSISSKDDFIWGFNSEREKTLDFRTSSSLWGTFILSKYKLKAALINNLQAPLSCSHTWRRVLHIKDQADHHIGVLVRNGESSYWQDQWLPCGRLASLYPFHPTNDLSVRDALASEDCRGILLQHSPWPVHLQQDQQDIYRLCNRFLALDDKQEGRAPVVLTIDGASHGNPGLSASGGILRFPDEVDGLAEGKLEVYVSWTNYQSQLFVVLKGPELSIIPLVLSAALYKARIAKQA
ncbi:hypothetical protein M9H77_23612 [Catharanthus roseus]|uniref:Uncharacterized protein n=1 Tax=Catharanthus roseus TaxID=4058 RepID=A0ACC0AVY3_CATRO|nr:hypothetical protein M9H77_23612 [Catharanthus roseus]